MTTRFTSVRRDADLAAIDKLVDDPRCMRDEHRSLESLRVQLNEAQHPLTDGQREIVAKIAKLVEARPQGERPSGAHLLDSLPRPTKPPSAIARSA